MKSDPDYFDPQVLRHQFTNRNQEIQVFEEQLVISPPVPVLMYYGVGGAGKTFLLRYLLNRYGYMWTKSPINGYPHAFLNFRPGHTPFSAPEALLQAKRQFHKNLKGIVFTRFDLLWGKWWERTHGMAIAHNRELLPEETSSIAELLQGVSAFPFVGDIAKAINLFGNITYKVQEVFAIQRVQEWFEERVKRPEGTSWKAALDIIDVEDLTQLLAMAFGADLADAAAELIPPQDRIILFIDTYENLEEHLENQTSFIQIMAEELLQQNANVLVVLAGRDMLHWAEVRNREGAWVPRNPKSSIWAQTIRHRDTDSPTRRYLEQCVVGELSKVDAVNYLLKRNISDPILANEIVKFTSGYPLALGVAADLLVETSRSGKQAIEELSDRTFNYQPLSEEWREEIVDWLVAKLFEQLRRGKNKELITLTKVAAVPRWFNRDLLFRMSKDYALQEKFEELGRYSFVESYRVETFQAFRLHTILRKLLLQQIDTEERVHLWNQAALEWFEQRAQQFTGSLHWRYELEVLYHSYKVNPEKALSLFQSMAEQLVRLQQVDKLEDLLSDLKSYMHERESSSFSNWYEYFGARLMELQRDLRGAEHVYAQIGDDPNKEIKLRAYALCDLANLMIRMENLGQEGGVQKALDTISRCEELGQPMDSKLIFLHGHRRSIHNYNCEWDQSILELQRQKNWLESHDDIHGFLRTMHELRGIYAMLGKWDEANTIYQQTKEEAAKVPENTFLQARLRLGLNWSLIWSGNYRMAELESKTGLLHARELNNVSMIAQCLREIAHAVAAQGRFAEAKEILEQSLELYGELGELFQGSLASALGIKGLIQMQSEVQDGAEIALQASFQIKKRLGDNMGIPELLLWLGELSESQGEWDRAAEYYTRYLDEYLWTGRQHFECEVYCGLLRVYCEQQNYAAIPSLLAKGEELAQKYRYMDHMANLHLLQGHLAWKGHFNNGDVFDDALKHYEAALFYGICFNRFLLDSLIGDHSISVPIRSIFTQCHYLGDEGKRMLTALRNWWEHSEVDELASQLKVQGIMGGCSLQVFEENQRALEPGDGSKQIMLEDRILAELEA